MRLCAVLVLLGALAAPAVAGESSRKTFTVLGGYSCIEWVTTRTKDKSSPYDLDNSFTLIRMKGWIFGYLTGVTEALIAKDKDVLSLVDGPTVFDWMDTYCAKHSEKSVTDGAIELLVAIRKLPGK